MCAGLIPTSWTGSEVRRQRRRISGCVQLSTVALQTTSSSKIARSTQRRHFVAIIESSNEVVSKRSNGSSVQEVLAKDRVPSPNTLRVESQVDLGTADVPVERYTSKAWHDLEVE